MKVKIISIGLISCLIILYCIFYNSIVIQSYDKANFLIVEKTFSNEDMTKMSMEIIADGYSMGSEEFINEYAEKLKECIQLTDYSKKGIICENIWVMGKSNKLSKYAVVYDDRTVKYVTGSFTTNPNFYAPDEEYMGKVLGKDNYIKGISNVIFVKNIFEKKEVKLSRFQYFVLINKLKLITLFKENTEDGKSFLHKFVEDYTTGFFLNDSCYVYEEKVRSDFSYKFKMNMRMNCDDYINWCLGYSDDMMAGKRRYGLFMLNP